MSGPATNNANVGDPSERDVQAMIKRAEATRAQDPSKGQEAAPQETQTGAQSKAEADMAAAIQQPSAIKR